VTCRRAARFAAVVALALGAGATGCGDGRPGAGPGEGDVPAVSPVRLSPTEPGPQGRVPQFVVECAYSHSGPNDPIVHPNHAGRSHLH
jgi:hypothetical protein